MATFGSVLEDIDIEVYDNHAYAANDWVKQLVKLNKLALSPYTFEEGAAIEEMGNSASEKFKGRKFQNQLQELNQFLKENKVDLGARIINLNQFIT